MLVSSHKNPSDDQEKKNLRPTYKNGIYSGIDCTLSAFTLALITLALNTYLSEYNLTLGGSLAGIQSQSLQ